MSWRSIPCKITELQLVGTLNGGQSFRWNFDSSNEEWTGIFSKTVWKLKQNQDGLLYQILGTLHHTSKDPIQNNAKKSTKITKSKRNVKAVATEADVGYFDEVLKKYFRLDVELSPLYEQWSARDALFGKAAKQFYGIRMLNQEPVENLFSFICSQNNHISRISTMIEKLCTNYGEKICSLDGKDFYSFPTVDKIAEEKVEQSLRDLGFGYRAKFIQQSAAKIQEWGDEAWFQSLVKMPYEEAKAELIKLPGVGAKVADCICLMSLGHLQAVPVDTHVFHIAAHNYLQHLQTAKSVTERVYTEIGEHFRQLYGPLAGWAHTVLFCADLKKFEPAGTKRSANQKNGKKVKRKK